MPTPTASNPGARIFIPPLGTVIELTEDWSFRLYNEGRNEKLQALVNMYPPFRDTNVSYPQYNTQRQTESWRDMTIPERKEVVDKSIWVNERDPELLQDYWGGDWHAPFVFRAETRLKIDRIYLRQGQSDYDSVTFRTDCWMADIGDPLFTKKYVNGRKVPSLRFWAKLGDVNQMVGRIIS